MISFRERRSIKTVGQHTSEQCRAEGSHTASQNGHYDEKMSMVFFVPVSDRIELIGFRDEA